MNRKQMCAVILGALLPVLSLSAPAADQAPSRPQSQIRDQDMYGHQMMTPQERDAYRTKMRAAKTVEEREQIRREHHEQMVARAKERGITLPDEPPARGAGQGPGMGGPGPGMGPGAGSGSGPGAGRGPRY